MYSETRTAREQELGVMLEVIACSLDDALAAWEGGATCLEVTVRLELAGLTPPIELVEQIVNRVPLPSRIMLRDRPDFVLSGKDELEIIGQGARSFAGLKVYGLVVGYIRDGRLDLDTLSQIQLAAPNLHMTVHHAIEATADPLQALSDLRTFSAVTQVDRALVRGGNGALDDRAKRLLEYKGALGPDRRLLVGGGLTVEMLAPLRRATGLTAFHLGRAVRTPEESWGQVDSTKVRRAVELLGS
jgi:copper homeostasis protein